MFNKFSNSFGDILKAAMAKKDDVKNAPLNSPNRETPVIVGLDFGTSFTKAYCNIAGVNAPIEFKVGEKTGFYLPSEVYFDKTKKFLSMKERPDFERIRYFKYNMINDELKGSHDDVQKVPFDVLCSVYFLANVIKEIKNEASQRAPGKTLKYHFNMGCPIANESSRFKGVYDRALNVAYVLSNLPLAETMSLERIASFYNANFSKSNALLRTVPELYAEALWFIDKYSTDEGIYAILDIGGGTVDYSTTSVRREGGVKKTDVYSQGAKPLGVEILLKKFFPQNYLTDRATCLLELIESKIRIPSHGKENPLVDVQHVHGNAFESLFFQGVMDAKDIRPNLMRQHYCAKPRRPISYYTFGGGAEMNWFHSIIKQHNEFIETAGIPKLEKETVKTDLPHNRLIIAYQLSQPSLPDIGQYPWGFKKVAKHFVDPEIPTYLLLDD